MTIERRKSEKGITARQPSREMEEAGRPFEDVFGRPFLPGIWRLFPSEKREEATSKKTEDTTGKQASS
jgi:hypothetical protein